jgi:alkylation response protein AidB-like acyl-CoA dehydrogenase
VCHPPLPQLSSGDLLGALCVAEEACGSDPASVDMTATLSDDGEYYLLNGTKTWVAGAGEAGLLTVLAKLSMKNYLGENDTLPTMFLVDRTQTSGIEVSEPRPLVGLRGLQLRDVTFTDCRVPVVLGRLGGEGEGLAVLASIVHHNKFLMAAGLITHLRGLLDETIRWTNSRKQFGLNLSEFTLVKHQIGQMAARLYCLEAMVYLVAGLKDVAEVPDVEVESVLVKLYAAEASDFITRGCLNLLGMRACMEDSK